MSIQTIDQGQMLLNLQSNLDITQVALPTFSQLTLSNSEAVVYARGDNRISLDTSSAGTEYFEADSGNIRILKTGNYKINFSIYVNTMGDGTRDEAIIVYLNSRNNGVVSQLYHKMNNLTSNTFSLIKIINLEEGDTITARINCIDAKVITEGGKFNTGVRLEITTY